MNTLIIDTSHTLLAVGLVIDEVLVYNYQEQVNKSHSEQLLPIVDAALKAHGINPLEINNVVLTVGPGSYTGLRIGMTFVKTFAIANPNLNVYTVNTLASLVGDKSGFAFIDARSKRTFGAYVDNGVVRDQRVYMIVEVTQINAELYGDLDLIENDKGKRYGSILENIVSIKQLWKPVASIDTLVPDYLK